MQRFFKGLNRAEEMTLTLALLALAVVAFVQVFCRYTLGISFSWFEEGGRYVGIAITFLGAAIGARRGDHFAMDLVLTSVGATKAKIMKVVVGLISGSVLSLVAVYGVKITMRQYAYENTTPAMQIPMYLVYIPIPLFAFVMALRFYKSSWTAFREKSKAEEGRKMEGLNSVEMSSMAEQGGQRKERNPVEKRTMVEEGGKA